MDSKDWSDSPGDDPTNAAMIKRDELAVKPDQPEADDRQTVLDAIDDLADFVSEDAINAGSFNPRLQGPNDPDIYGRERKECALLKAIDDLLARRLAQALPKAPVCDPVQVEPSGLFTVHNPDARGKL